MASSTVSAASLGSLKEMTELAAVYECVNAAAELYEVPKPIARAFARVVG